MACAVGSKAKIYLTATPTPENTRGYFMSFLEDYKSSRWINHAIIHTHGYLRSCNIKTKRGQEQIAFDAPKGLPFLCIPPYGMCQIGPKIHVTFAGSGEDCVKFNFTYEDELDKTVLLKYNLRDNQYGLVIS